VGGVGIQVRSEVSWVRRTLANLCYVILLSLGSPLLSNYYKRL
jgi:hypothetical protein